MHCLASRPFDWPGNMTFPTDGPLQMGRITCTATRDSLACRNADGHGFSLSRKAQQVY